MDRDAALRAFSALAHPVRLDALRLLIGAGPRGLPAGEVARRLGAPQSTVSANLTVLGEAGLVATHREGRIVRHAPVIAAVQGLAVYLMADCCGGRPDLCRPVAKALAPEALAGGGP